MRHELDDIVNDDPAPWQMTGTQLRDRTEAVKRALVEHPKFEPVLLKRQAALVAEKAKRDA